MIYDQFLEAGYPIFGLHGIKPDGSCGCENQRCQSAGKHPVLKQWQHSPLWSEEQLEVMHETGQLATGYGVLCNGLIVIDIDPRNGGNRSFKKLAHIAEQCQFVVATGGGGKHLYFKAPDGVALVSHLADYKGIDFKSNGYVVGPGSIHASGKKYEVLFGSPHDITEAPEELIELLRKPETNRAEYNGFNVDFKDSDIVDMLDHLDPNMQYDQWIRVGMSVHDATGGAGFDLWDLWSSKGKDYPGRGFLDNKWHSFGKSERVVGIGTLIYMAEQAGWSRPVTFESDFEFVEPAISALPTVDLLRPPGFVGELTEWINSQCLYPREHLAVAAALVSIGNIGGLRYIDDISQITANLFAFCVAGSATGKESVISATRKIHRAAGIVKAVHEKAKSQQEIIENLIDHQASYYLMDEVGYLLQKIASAKKNGGAIYLEGIPAELMSIYSKANDYYLITGSKKKEIKRALYAQLEKIENERGDTARIRQLIEEADEGIKRPFLSLLGFATPVSFDAAIDYEQATNGFFGRCLIFHEKETNPMFKEDFYPTPMPESMAMTLAAMHNQGEYYVKTGRIEYHGDFIPILTVPEAKERLKKIALEFIKEAEDHKNNTGLESIPRRGYEMVAKVSLILAIPSGVRTLEMVEWAYALVKKDILEKTRLAYANMCEKESPGDALILRIENKLDKEKGMKAGVLISGMHMQKKADLIHQALAKLEASGRARKEKKIHKGNKKEYYEWYAT